MQQIKTIPAARRRKARDPNAALALLVGLLGLVVTLALTQIGWEPIPVDIDGLTVEFAHAAR